MRLKLFVTTAALAVASLCATAVNAQTVNETAGPNGSIATAQDLSGTFGLAADPNVQNSTTVPHVTVIGGSNFENEQDFYTFTVAVAGSQAVFDIDFGYTGNSAEGDPDFDSYLTLWTLDGSILAQNDDCCNDPGSTDLYGVLDAFLPYTFANAGTYAVAVGACCANGGRNFNGGYRLNVSLTAPGTTMGAVPEPGTWTMMLIGFGAIGASMRRRRTNVVAQIA